MADVIEIPTQLMVREHFKDGHGITSEAVEGSVVMTINGAELWLSFEEAADLLERLGDAVCDAFTQLRNELEEKNDRS